MHDFDETFVLVFNSFLKIKLNCDKENMFFLNTCSFQKKMLSNLKSGPNLPKKNCLVASRKAL